MPRLLLATIFRESVYDWLLAATRESPATGIERYYKLRVVLLGIDDLAMYDMYVQLGAGT